MLLKSFIAIPALLLSGLAAYAQTPDVLKSAYDQNDVFALRDAVSHGNASTFYKGVVEASANNIPAAEADLRTVVQHDPQSNDSYEAHDVLGNMYFRNGMYHEGYGEIVAALKQRPEASDAKSMLSIFTALNALPKMAVLGMKPTSMKIESGSIFLPIKANGRDVTFFFDTGAGISLIGESEAKELGIVAKPVEGKMGDASGQGVSGLQLATVSDLRIGGLRLRNVPFIVVADTGEPWNHLPKSRHGIIGLPLLLAMHTIRWAPTGTFDFGFPSEPINLNTCNMLFHNSNPILDVVVETKHLEFTLDTGAVDTDLNPTFGKALPSLMNRGSAEKRSIEGLGGNTENASILLPSVTLTVGGKDVVLKPAHVFTEHGNGTWAAGNLGMDLLKQAHAFTLDFGAMTLRLH